ncbi:hypothetical protein RND81_12G090500 [Saponaria officinalis]|uniref:No apical meristem-associated C-terminal domain-containing protein n=1 Tax=Saponaria officinalis TaxID=3572 RepID=A0AAW1H8C2_SAPOF
MDNNNRNYGNNPYSQDNQNNQFNLNNLPLDQNFLNSPQGQMFLQMLTNPTMQNYSNSPSNLQNQFQQRRFQQSPTISIPQQLNQPIEHSPGGNKSSNRTPSEDLWGAQQLQKKDSAIVELFADEGNKERSGRVKWRTNQNKGDLWKTIARLYEEAREDALTAIKERSFKSLTSRWDTINRDVSRWVGVYAQAQRDKASGQSDEDVENHAHYLYQQRYNGVKFTLMHAWKEMRHMRKWQAGNNELPSESGGSSKRSQPDTPTDERENFRPEGIKKAKKKGKQVASSSVNMDSFSNAISEMNVRNSSRESVAIQLLEYQKERDAAKAKQKEDDRQWQLYMFLLSKTHLEPNEKVMLDNLKEKFSYMFT